MDGSGKNSPSQQAAGWYARLRAPDCTAEDRAAFDAWRTSDPRNAAAYAAAERMNDALAKLTVADPRLRAMVDQAASAGATLPEDPIDEQPGRKPTSTVTAEPTRTLRARRRIARPWAWVAGLTAVVGGLLFMAMGGTEPSGTLAEYRDGAGRAVIRYASGATRRAVTLDDGTRVYLDVASTIEVRFTATQRDVTLVHGRALFDVAHDASRAFIVTAGTDLVTTLGTVFQVDRAATEVVVTLASGAVSVRNRSGSVDPVRLVPGEELRSSAGNPRWVKRTVDAQSATSWSVGKHIFRDRPLIEAVREINRYADKKIRLAEPRLAALVVNGEFAAGDSEAIVTALAAALPLQVTATPGELVLY